MYDSNNEQKLIQKLRLLQKKCPENRKCANCNEMGPNYICMDFGTFICTICSGIHREFTHKVKGISVSKWSIEEIEFIENHGNLNDYKKYLVNRDLRLGPFPTSSQIDKLKEFIKHKYVDKLWIDWNFHGTISLNNNNISTRNQRELTNNYGLNKNIQTRSNLSPVLRSGKLESGKSKGENGKAETCDLLGLGDYKVQYDINNQYNRNPFSNNKVNITPAWYENIN
ncbi:hypothetical protein cand_028010 [Cryptosporidium andersoni]|uniref:Arf-GAP domain-containing protein n=1 Tax=Cryptosporidium andersoni TaxID=117008 RepID=A0A1J4MR61_9CRYT|nr:hypothetical protein cand_028010 [Cryptosporidium andersoni]